MSLLKATFRVGRSQVLAMGSQVIAAAPIIAMSIYLSRVVGLSAVADFALLIGASSVIFTLAMIGLRSRLVLDRFCEFEEVDYYNLRILATAIMASVIMFAGYAFGAPVILTLAVALLRVGDSALDLTMAIDQVRRDSREHMYGYLNGSTFKLVVIVSFLAIGHLPWMITPYLAFASAGAVYAVYAWALFLKRRVNSRPLFSASFMSELGRLVRNSAVFAVAAIICACMTSAPRLALEGIDDRNMAGAVGAALSVSTLVAMAYFAVWLRWVPRFGSEGLQAAHAFHFVFESSVVLCLAMVTLWLIGAPLMTLIYAIDTGAHLDMALMTLLTSTAFFFTMTLANLFKPSQIPWAESFVHLGGIMAIGITSLVQVEVSIPSLLLAGALGMASVEAFSLLLLLRYQRGMVV